MSGRYLLLPTLLVIFISFLIVRAAAIEKGGHWIPTPKADETFQEGDRLVVYGPLNVLKALFRRG